MASISQVVFPLAGSSFAFKHSHIVSKHSEVPDSGRDRGGPQPRIVLELQLCGFHRGNVRQGSTNTKPQLENP